MAWRIGKNLQSVATVSKISNSEVIESVYQDHSRFKSVLTPEANVLAPVCIRSLQVEEGIETSKKSLLHCKVRKQRNHS